MPTELPPFLPFLIGALLTAVTRGRLRSAVMLATPVVGGICLLGIDSGALHQVQLLGYTLTPVRVDELSMLFGYLFHLGAFIAILYAVHIKDTLQHVVAMIYAASALGAVFAGDLISFFLSWELLTVSSVFLVWARRTPQAIRAGFRYLILQIGSGVTLLAGILIHVHATGDISMGHIGLDTPGGWLIMLALGLKCGFPMLHMWLTDAYPESTPTGAVFLCMFTTKCAIYALTRSFAGADPLIYIGTAMTFFPIFFAVIENDLRRVLAYSMINQLGFMVCGIGLGTALALNGAVSHAFNDVLFKGLLFMAMGAVLTMTGRTRASLWLRQQVHDHAVGSERGTHGGLVVPAVCLGGCTRARRDKDPVLRILRSRLRTQAARTTHQHAPGHADCGSPVCRHRHGSGNHSLPVATVRGGIPSLRRHSRYHSAAIAHVRRPGGLLDDAHRPLPH
jgi:multicomponent Na+:H+ antiporter subunit D